MNKIIRWVVFAVVTLGGYVLTRIYLTSSKSYKLERRTKGLPFNLDKLYTQIPTPKFIWVCEISTIELYKENNIIGELIFDATANALDRFAFLCIHYPDFLLLNNRDYFEDTPARFNSYKLDTDKLIPYPLYVSNLKEV